MLKQQTTESSKPIDITINIDGEKKDYTYDPNTGELVEGGSPELLDPNFDKSPFLGVGFIEENKPTPFGIVVDHVYEKAPAAIAGVQNGDIIMKLNGESVETHEHLSELISKCKANETVSLEIARVKGDKISFITINAKLTYRGNFDIPTVEQHP